MTTQQLHAIVRGRVQGVYFRATICEVAERLALSGCVQLSGRVGRFCRRSEPLSTSSLLLNTGPDGARVAEVVVD
jgi:acylphosphatase